MVTERMEAKLRKVATKLRDEAENISPLDGASGGEAHPAPQLRKLAKELEHIADECKEIRK